jgi:hypothetical protein
MFDYRKAKNGGTEKEILAYEKKHSPNKTKALRKKQSSKGGDWAAGNRETGGKSHKGFEKYTG